MFGYGSKAGPIAAAVLTVVLGAATLFLAIRAPAWRIIPRLTADLTAPGHHHQTLLPPTSSTAERPMEDPLGRANPPQVFVPVSPSEAERRNAEIPFSPSPIISAAPFETRQASPQDLEQARKCLAMAVYYEAGYEPIDGERAVAQVVLNRVRHALFPKTVCGVVFQGSQLRTGCQFTFSCDGSLGRPPQAGAWRRAVAVADEALAGRVFGAVGLATHYHTSQVFPAWAPELTKMTRIGAHLFYRWGGILGLPSAMNGRYSGGEAAPANAGWIAFAGENVVPSTSPALTPMITPPVADLSPLPTKPTEIHLDRPSQPVLAARVPEKLPIQAPQAQAIDHVSRLPIPAHW